MILIQNSSDCNGCRPGLQPLIPQWWLAGMPWINASTTNTMLRMGGHSFLVLINFVTVFACNAIYAICISVSSLKYNSWWLHHRNTSCNYKQPLPGPGAVRSLLPIRWLGIGGLHLSWKPNWSLQRSIKPFLETICDALPAIAPRGHFIVLYRMSSTHL